MCCLSSEAKRPLRDVPLSIALSLVLITAVHVLAAVALSGLVPNALISSEAPFAAAFAARGLAWAGSVVAAGEIIVLPGVVLVCFMAQPR